MSGPCSTPDPHAPAPAACLYGLPALPACTACLHRRELQIKLEEDRKRLIEAINTTFGNLGSAAAGLLTDRDKLLAAVGGLSLLALGIYSGGWVGQLAEVGVKGWSVGSGWLLVAVVCTHAAARSCWLSLTLPPPPHTSYPPLQPRRAPAPRPRPLTAGLEPPSWCGRPAGGRWWGVGLAPRRRAWRR